MKDGYNSAIRYYYNNFADGFRQVRERGEGEGGREGVSEGGREEGREREGGRE